MLSLKSVITVNLCLKDMAWKHTAYHANKSDAAHTRLKQKWKKCTQLLSVLLKTLTPTNEKEKAKNISYDKAFLRYTQTQYFLKSCYFW